MGKLHDNPGGKVLFCREEPTGHLLEGLNCPVTETTSAFPQRERNQNELSLDHLPLLGFLEGDLGLGLGDELNALCSIKGSVQAVLLTNLLL